MVLGDVEHRAGIGFEPFRLVKLEAAEFEHPDLRQAVAIDRIGQRVP
jgi:hypothetical protein